MNEIWKDIPGYNGKYKISNFGNIMSINYLNTGRDRLLKKKLHHSGYLLVRLCGGNRKIQHNKLIHRLVAESFIPNPLNKKCVNHIDGDKTNNHVNNLEWVTYKENSTHAIRTGLKDPHNNNQKHGKNNINSKQIEQYSKTGEFIKLWDCISDAARFIGCNPCMITNNASGRSKSCHGYIWKYVSNT